MRYRDSSRRIRPSADYGGGRTAINSVETLANVPDIFEFGPDWFREVGAEGMPGTKLIQLSGAFRNRGVIELPLGTPVSEIVELGEPSEALAGVTMGGPSGGFLAPENFDTPIAPGQMDGHGAAAGRGRDHRHPAIVRD